MTLLNVVVLLAARARLLNIRRIQLQMLLVIATLLAALAWGFAW